LKAVGGIGFVYNRTPMDKAIEAAGSDLRGAAGDSAIVIVSDFSDEPGIDDLRIEAVISAAAKLDKEYGDKLCIYTIQVGNVPGGKELAEQLVQSVRCGDAVNADDLATPAAMAAFVEKIISGKGSLHGAAVAAPVGAGAISDADAAERARAAALARERELAEANRLAGRTDLEHIRFDFDKSTLRPKDREVLKRHSEMFLKEKETTIIVEGHCDEIGTTEYNLALGQRRAAEVMKYLVASGVDEKRIKTISYGKERPLDLGHTDEARATNRRAQFIVKPSRQ
jgi:OOP family OmpA-OmpF porin